MGDAGGSGACGPQPSTPCDAAGSKEQQRSGGSSASSRAGGSGCAAFSCSCWTPQHSMPSTTSSGGGGGSDGRPPMPAWRAQLERLAPATKSSVPVTPVMLLLSAVVYGVLVFAIGKVFLPGGPAFAALVIWICSVAGAQLAHWLRIPRVVGMLGTGLLLANVPGGVVAAFPPKWGVQMRAAALATIFLRCGLELEFKTMALYKWPALRLAFLPGLAEALFDAGVAHAVFGMPPALALSLGFILKAVGPGLVVPAMFQLQKLGLGSRKGIPSTVVIAASFDDIIAITGFSIFINVAIATGEGAAWQIASGPLQVLFGMAGGLLAGVVLGATRVFDDPCKRLVGIYGSALLIMFFLEFYDMLSGGALGSLTVGLVTVYCWERGLPRRCSAGPSQAYSAGVERVAAVVWNWAMEPMLFATIGSSIVFARLPAQTISKSVLVVVTGLALRLIVTFVVMGRRRYSGRERLFFSLAWTPKATVQASLSAVPLSLINRLYAGHPDYETWERWGQDILATGIFAIIICASLGTLAVYWTAPLLLEREVPEAGDKAPDITRLSKDASRLVRQRSTGREPTLTTLTLPNGESVALDPATVLAELRGAEDHTLINNYFDAIESLVALVAAGQGSAAQSQGLCETVLRLQEAIARDVGPRELTVRQMLHSAALRSRQPTIPAAAADQLVRLSLSTLGDPAMDGGGSLTGTSPRSPRGGGSRMWQLDAADLEWQGQQQQAQQQQHNGQPHGQLQQRHPALESVGSNVLPAHASSGGSAGPSHAALQLPRPPPQQRERASDPGGGASPVSDEASGQRGAADGRGSAAGRHSSAHGA